MQGPLLDTNTDLVTEVINSQNPRETRVPEVEVPTMPPVPAMTVPELSPELMRREVIVEVVGGLHEKETNRKTNSCHKEISGNE